MDGNYFIYLRKSRSDADSIEEVLARHESILTALAKSKGITIKSIYREVVSGETIAARPVMQQVLTEVENGLWDGGLVMEVERLARGDTLDQGIVAQTFKYSNTLIITPSKTYNPANDDDEEYFEFNLFMSRREYKTINRRQQRGRKSSLSEGRYIASTAPYGYKRVRLPDKGYTLEIIEDKAEIVRMIYQFYCIGETQPDGSLLRMGPDMIAARLDSMGIESPLGNKWSKATISDILRNPTYAGMVRFGYRKYVKKMSGGRIIQNRHDTPDCLIYPGKHPAIISQDLFDTAAKLRVVNRKNTLPSTQALQNPFSGLIYCGKCGKLMTRLAPNSRNRYATIKCLNRYCDNVSSPIYLIENEVLAFLQSWLHEYHLKEKSVPETGPIEKDIKLREAAIQNLQAELTKLHNQLDKAYTLLEQEVYTVDVFKKRESALHTAIDSAESSIKTIHKELEHFKQVQSERTEYIPKIEFLLETYKTNSPAENNTILKEIIERIEYVKDSPNKKHQIDNVNFQLQIYPRLPQ